MVAVVSLLAKDMLGSDRLAGMGSAAFTTGAAITAIPLSAAMRRRGRRTPLAARIVHRSRRCARRRHRWTAPVVLALHHRDGVLRCRAVGNPPGSIRRCRPGARPRPGEGDRCDRLDRDPGSGRRADPVAVRTGFRRVARTRPVHRPVPVRGGAVRAQRRDLRVLPPPRPARADGCGRPRRRTITPVVAGASFVRRDPTLAGCDARPDRHGRFAGRDGRGHDDDAASHERPRSQRSVGLRDRRPHRRDVRLGAARRPVRRAGRRGAGDPVRGRGARRRHGRRRRRGVRARH